jgi:hypothetical protein
MNIKRNSYLCTKGVTTMITPGERCSGFSILFGFRHEMRQITPEILQNVRDACYYRFAICQEKNGVNFEHLLH